MRQAALSRSVENDGARRRAQILQEEVAKAHYLLPSCLLLLQRKLQCPGQADSQSDGFGARPPPLLLVSAHELRDEFGMPANEEHANPFGPVKFVRRQRQRGHA